MALRIGIVGLPNVGKSTLFNALTRSRGAQAANYPFCTIEPNVGIVEVPDSRLDDLARIVQPKRVIPAAIEFVDIAGLVKGASSGEGLGNAFLSHIRDVDALCHVVRSFEGGDIIHVEGNVHPKRDREIIETELMLADVQTLEKRIAKLQGAARTGDASKKRELVLAERLADALRSGVLVASVTVDAEESLLLRDMHLLTAKPMVYAVNVAEQELAQCSAEEARTKLGLDAASDVLVISANIEEEMQELSPEDAASYLADLGVQSSGLDRLIRSAYHALGLRTYFTAGVQEVRAWTIRAGFTAPQAAGVIHSDFERGFIRAETISFIDFVNCAGEAGAKEAGKLRVEGKDYVVQDGDVLHFRFNV